MENHKVNIYTKINVYLNDKKLSQILFEKIMLKKNELNLI